ncbi:aminoglycoside N(3)-acetyltransferase [Mesorhizobium sp. NPDC059025]|uniref:aminoglycoside N(3)-acetyltransferase n=1 Tax=unclassified Mesorhizobium TaxID=325217 RepID=UPI003678A7C7
MTEHRIVAATPEPRTRDSLIRDLRHLGVKAGETLLVHCALSRLGWVSGGAETVVRALLGAITETGTLVMPAQSSQLSDPVHWQAPAVPENWIEIIRETLPAFDPLTTPTRDMGAVAELFRTWPGARRSLHPTCSFSALGPSAETITERQLLAEPFGKDGPLGYLHRSSARILLLGAEFDACTAFHLAEHMAWPSLPRIAEGSPLIVDGQRRWVNFSIATGDADRFPKIGKELIRQGLVQTGTVGSATCHLMSMPAVVDAAARIMAAQQPPSG